MTEKCKMFIKKNTTQGESKFNVALAITLLFRPC